MKATRQEKPKPFEPVVLTLETQEEVNRLALCFNHANLFPQSKFPDIETTLDNYATIDNSGSNFVEFCNEVGLRP